ncbi:MAG TPA: hypothetical protein VHC49_02450 [Mycobacteriales bacterium]|nr:hypothetical protein [Mycobacteriales bacterium]
MRWERLFADLEAQLDATDEAEFAGEIVERTRVEIGAIRLVDRMRAAVGSPARISTLGSETVAGKVDRVGPDWILLAERADRSALIPHAAITTVAGLGARTAPQTQDRVWGRLDLRYALRGLVRDRAPVAVTLTDAGSVIGTIDRVGADYLEIAEHPAGEPRRSRTIRQVRTIPLGALAVVRAG